MKLTVQRMFGAMVAAIFIASSTSAGFMYMELARAKTYVDDVAGNWLLATEYVGQISSAIRDIRISESYFIAAENEGDLQKAGEHQALAKQELKEAFDLYEPTVTSDEEKPILEAIKIALTTYLADHKNFMERIASDKQRGVAFYNNELEASYANLSKAVAHSLHFQVVNGEKASKAAIEEMAKMKLVMIIGCLMSVAISIATILFILSRISQGMSFLAHLFKSSASKVIASSEETRLAVASLISASEETSTQAKIVLHNSSEAAQFVAAVANSVKELNISIEDIGRSVVETTGCVEQAMSEAETASQVVVELGKVAIEIGEVVTVITSLAEQTNLLALNAAIEAARAGDAGRGFAVVADEVKKLASNTTEATGGISDKVRAIQEVAHRCSTSLGSVSNAISRIHDIANSVSAAVAEQSSVAKDITQNVSESAERVAQVEQNMQGIEQAASDTNVAAGQVSGASHEVDGSFGEMSKSMAVQMADLGFEVK